MSSPEPVTRLPSRSPPGPASAEKSLLERLALRLFVDIFGGEADESTQYLRSLPAKMRSRARERADERAEAVHKSVLTGLACTRVLMMAACIMVMTLMFLFVVSLASGNLEFATLQKVGLIGTPLSVVIGIGTWGWKRRHISESGGRGAD